MGGACNPHGTDEKLKQFWLENLKGRDHLVDLGVDERIILDWVLEK
jgi:hypothetical protein